MSQSSVFTLAMASILVQQLQTIVDFTSQPCQELCSSIAALTARFLRGPITPAATFAFEKDLQRLLDECGRFVVEVVFNHIEPETPQEAPQHTQRDRLDYTRKNHKSRNRGGIATLFGIIDLRRCVYEPLQEARDDGQRSFAPVEVCLGVVAHNATPALAERVGQLASQHTQEQLLDILRRDYHVGWSVTVLRQVTAAVSTGIAPYLRAAQQNAVLGWLAEAYRSRGRHRVVLAVGRDGIMLPIRQAEHYQEGAVATISVYDRRGRRLGTVYLGQMPEAHQTTLSAELTAFVKAVLLGWAGILPRLVYLTDAGYHPTTYFEEVLRPMEHPRRAGQRLEWLWIVDYYHAAGYVTRLAQVLFREETTRHAWARRMRRLLRDTRRGVIRVLHSAAQYYGRKAWEKEEAKEYAEAYGYLLRHSKDMHYSEYKRLGLPIGSGVTEAGCKIVFTQRFKQSGMTWGVAGGEVILRLRLAELSGVYDEVYREYLQNQPLVSLATSPAISPHPDATAA